MRDRLINKYVIALDLLIPRSPDPTPSAPDHTTREPLDSRERGRERGGGREGGRERESERESEGESERKSERG